MSEELKSLRYEAIVLPNESTVVAEFQPEFQCVQNAAYQSEAALERTIIQQLQRQAYDYLALTP